MLSKVETSQAPSSSLVTPVAVTLLGGFTVWQIMRFLNKDKSEKETEKAREETLKHTLNIQKTKEKTAKLEQTTYFTGVNGYGKTVKDNPIVLAKDAIKAFYNVINLQSGKTLYKPKKETERAKFLHAVFSTPLNALSVFSKAYSAYTGNSFLDDANTLPYADYAKIKGLFNVSQSKFPRGWK